MPVLAQVILFILVLLVSPVSQAVNTTFTALLSDQHNWHTLSSVSNSNITSIAQGKPAGLWLSYDNSVHYYDGLNISHYSVPKDKNWGKIQFITLVDNTHLYVFFKNTIVRLNDGLWHEVAQNISLISGDKAIQDPTQRIWFITRNKLGWIEQNRVNFSDKLGTDIRAFLLDRQGYLWIADSYNGSISQLSFKQNKINLKHQWQGVLDPNNTGWSSYRLLQDKQDRIWSISSGYYNPPVYADYNKLLSTPSENADLVWQQEKYFNSFSDNTHHEIEITPNGEIIIIGNQQIYKRSQTGQWQNYPHPFGMAQSFSEKYQLTISDSQALLLKKRFAVKRLNFNKDEVSVYNGLLYGCQDNQQNRYFLDKNNGVRRWHAADGSWKTWDVRNGLISDPVAVYCHHNKVYVLGGDSKQAALSLYDGRNWITLRYPQLGHLIHFEKILFKNNALYIGGVDNQNLTRLLKLDSDGKILKHIRQTVREQKIASAKNEILAVVDKQIYRQYANDLMAYPIPQPKTPIDWITDLKVDQSGQIWVSSWDDGLYKVRQNTWSNVGQLNGLTTKHVANMLLDQQNNLYALSDQGLISYQQNHWVKRAIPQIHVERQNSQLLQAADSSVWINQASRDWYLRKHGYIKRTISFFSLNLKNNHLPPDTQIELTHPLTPGISSLSLFLSGRDAWDETSMNNLQFSFRVNQSEWSKYSQQAYQTISNLNPGKHYLIQARAIDQDGNIDPAPAELSIYIPAVFWQTSWFKIISAFITLLIPTLFVMLYVQRLRHINLQEQSKLRFMAQITHELRSPLSLIANPLEILNAKIQDSELKQQAQFALKNSQRLTLLIEQILDYKKLQTHNLTQDTQTNDLVLKTRSICCDLSLIAQEKQQKLIFLSNRSVLVADFNLEAWNKILDNLVINAFKYSSPGATILVGLFIHQETQIKLLVQDYGKGITKDEQKHLFSHLSKPLQNTQENPVDAYRIRSKFKSYGIGLALVKELIDKLNGKIEITSPANEQTLQQTIYSLDPSFCFLNQQHKIQGQAIGPGTLFKICLNLQTVDTQTIQHIQEECRPVIDNRTCVASKTSDYHQHPKANLLIVDDNRDLVDYLKLNLSHSFSISCAENGQVGFKIAKQTLPDIILSDIYMPIMSGIQMSKELQCNSLTAHIPIILMTSTENSQLKTDAFIAGVIDYINKPILLNQLTLKLQNILFKQNLLIKRQALKPFDHLDDRFMARIDSLLMQKLSDENFNIDELAKALAMSRSAFYRKCNQKMEMSPAEYITRFKLQQAKSLLHKDMTIAEVAAHIGYADSSAFGRIFKKHYKLSPSVYRETHKEL